jgi:hypothetical protein
MNTTPFLFEDTVAAAPRAQRRQRCIFCVNPIAVALGFLVAEIVLGVVAYVTW